eukprot:TRINITY_DN3979_c0_g1_i1.p1 TRINITY_DN3979_c0_g1~~TRINITY_DN3979_c0_g1_i1.p1  ORF type:complete len:617 (-),score=135.33 TRINITY_DN3979_c0_g1_i1:117-1967(-)
MPRRKKCGSLYSASLGATAKQLLKGCQEIDSKTEPFSQYNKIRDSPLKISPSREVEDADLCVEQRDLKKWLGNLPDTVVQDVFRLAMQQLESQLMVDKDKKLILTLINIESIKMSDFLFGVHSLLKILRGFAITDLNVSKRLWLILWEYEEILHQGLLKQAISEALPHLAAISTLSLPYLADDGIMNVIRKYLPCLISLDVSHSCVTDRGLRHLMSPCFITSGLMQPNPSVIRSLTSLLDSPENAYSSQIVWNSDGRVGKCLASELEVLKMESCDSVTDSGIRFVLEHYTNLKTLVYHQRRSVLEILLKWLAERADNDKKPQVRLEQLEHAFPYSIAPFSEQLATLTSVCTRLTAINIVTEDFVLPHFVGFSHLNTLTVELEDCIGEGFIIFLQQKGQDLRELYVSCSTDPDSTLSTVQGGHQGQLFNIVTLASGIYCTKVKKLSVSGCGLVSKEAMDSIQLTMKLNSTNWIRTNTQTWFRQLSHLMLMSYEDTMPSMTMHSVLLQHVLSNVPVLQVLNLEGNFGSYITDDYMRHILRQNKFASLRILDISVNDHGGVQGRIPLSLTTVQAFIDLCPNLVELRMSDWNITTEEFGSLTKSMSDNNYNLVLTRKIRA